MLWYSMEKRSAPARTCITCGKQLSAQMLKAIFCRGSEDDPWIIVGWECLVHSEEHGPAWPMYPDTVQLDLVPCMPKWGYQNKTPFTGFCDTCGRGIGMEQTYRANMEFNGRKWIVASITCHACGWKDEHKDRAPYLRKGRE